MLECKQFINADEIAKGLSPFNPESVAIEAGRLMLQRIKFMLSQYSTFAIETTLSTRSYINLVQKAQKKGYQVVLLFFWLSSPEMALERVAKRVKEGGHNIPTDTIFRRYWLGLHNFFNLFIPIVDKWMLIDNIDNPILIANDQDIIDKIKFSKIKKSCQNKKI